MAHVKQLHGACGWNIRLLQIDNATYGPRKFEVNKYHFIYLHFYMYRSVISSVVMTSNSIFASIAASVLSDHS